MPGEWRKGIVLLVSHEKNILTKRFKLLGPVLATVFCDYAVLSEKQYWRCSVGEEKGGRRFCEALWNLFSWLVNKECMM